jgi:hypothetical protein
MHFIDGATQMLAEKFFLLLETLRSHRQDDGAPRVVSTSPHVPVKLGGDKRS